MSGGNNKGSTAITDGLIRSVGDIPRYHAGVRPEATALVFEGRVSSYARWNDRASQVANALIGDGCGPASRVALFAKNSDWYYEIYGGTAKSNTVLVGVNWRLAAPEVAQVIRDSDAGILFIAPEFAPMIDQIKDELGAVRRIITLGEARGDWPGYEDWLATASNRDPMVPVSPQDVAIQLYTSGTTGLPKGVMLTNENILEALKAVEAGVYGELDAGNERILMCMPNFHIAGSNWGMFGFAIGAAIHVLKEVDPVRILETIEREKITRALFVPAVIMLLVQHPLARTTDFASLKTVVYGASPAPFDLLRQAMATFDCGLVQAYGLTETTGTVISLPEGDHDPAGNKRMHSCGKPLPGTTVRIVDVNGQDLPPHTVGEILIRSKLNMAGYWKRPEDTAKAFVGEWFRSGDAGYLDEDGYVYIHDRVKDMIVSGGENIYPAEIESALFGHPAIADVAVIGVPDDKWGEAVKAVVVLKPGQDVEAAELIAFAKTRIAGYKVPKSVDFAPVLPRNPSGKLLKRELRKPYWEGRDRQVN
jgi:acyl-CoA synthetase (AMP-forming)/AMP-acid ligase II